MYKASSATEDEKRRK